jgi:DNA-directed RNA polymerase subunit N (RpoN/RPB10)
MRLISSGHKGQCLKCGKTIDEDAHALYERAIGLYCLECGEPDADTIREYRQAFQDAKAERYEGWAEKREVKSSAVLERNRSGYYSDHAFCTQPGRIP